MHGDLEEDRTKTVLELTCCWEVGSGSLWVGLGRRSASPRSSLSSRLPGHHDVTSSPPPGHLPRCPTLEPAGYGLRRKPKLTSPDTAGARCLVPAMRAVTETAGVGKRSGQQMPWFQGVQWLLLQIPELRPTPSPQDKAPQKTDCFLFRPLETHLVCVQQGLWTIKIK